MMMARLSLLHSLPRLASIAPFLCLIVAQWEWPDMASPSQMLPVVLSLLLVAKNVLWTDKGRRTTDNVEVFSLSPYSDHQAGGDRPSQTIRWRFSRHCRPSRLP